MGVWYGDVVHPTGGRRARYELARWLHDEQSYIDGKFNLPSHVDDMSRYELPRRQVEQYLDRAQAFMGGAKQAYIDGRPDDARILEAKAQQAIGKAITTLCDVGESAIDAWGIMPRPAVPSGTIVLDD